MVALARMISMIQQNQRKVDEAQSREEQAQRQLNQERLRNSAQSGDAAQNQLSRLTQPITGLFASARARGAGQQLSNQLVGLKIQGEQKAQGREEKASNLEQASQVVSLLDQRIDQFQLSNGDTSSPEFVNLLEQRLQAGNDLNQALTGDRLLVSPAGESISERQQRGQRLREAAIPAAATLSPEQQTSQQKSRLEQQQIQNERESEALVSRDLATRGAIQELDIRNNLIGSLGLPLHRAPVVGQGGEAGVPGSPGFAFQVIRVGEFLEDESVTQRSRAFANRDAEEGSVTTNLDPVQRVGLVARDEVGNVIGMEELLRQDPSFVDGFVGLAANEIRLAQSSSQGASMVAQDILRKDIFPALSRHIEKNMLVDGEVRIRERVAQSEGSSEAQGAGPVAVLNPFQGDDVSSARSMADIFNLGVQLGLAPGARVGALVEPTTEERMEMFEEAVSGIDKVTSGILGLGDNREEVIAQSQELAEKAASGFTEEGISAQESNRIVTAVLRDAESLFGGRGERANQVLVGLWDQNLFSRLDVQARRSLLDKLSAEDDLIENVTPLQQSLLREQEVLRSPSIFQEGSASQRSFLDLLQKLKKEQRREPEENDDAASDSP